MKTMIDTFLTSFNFFRALSLIFCLTPLLSYAQLKPDVVEPTIKKKKGASTDSNPSPPPSIKLRDRQQLINKVQAFYAKAKDFQADFKQTYTYQIYGRKKISTGKVFFKKPFRMRWDYEVPTQRVFVADGQTLWVYEPEESQVFKRDLASAQLPVALRFMQGEAQLDQEFNIESLVVDKDPMVVLSLSPKTPSPDFKILKLNVDASNGEVKSSTLIDPTGNSNEIKFVSVKVNQDLPNNGFSFTPPTGVRVIDEENSQ